VTNIRFVQHRIAWILFEPTRGNYTADPIFIPLQMCIDNGKNFIAVIQTQGGGVVPSQWLPSYLTTEAGGEGGWYIEEGTNKPVAKLYLQAIMDRLIALQDWLSNQVVPNSGGLTLDQHPNFEGLVFHEESSINPNPLPGDPTYSRQALATQLKRIMSAAKQSWTNTHVFSQLNFLTGEMDALVAHADSVGCGISWPDTVPDDLNHTAAQRVILGLTEAGTGGGIDYRGRIPLLGQVQTPELGGKEDPAPFHTMAEIGDKLAFLGCTHGAWVRTGQAPPRPNWANDILPYLQGSPAQLWQQCPTRYPACSA
jgi:hypothetical protein